MDDRELLELAAKAARIQLEWNGDFPVEVFERWSGDPDDFPERDYRDWNPLSDDGDALRLAAALDINIFFFRKHVDVMAESRWQLPVREDFEREWKKGAATRLAILRAAAEIGKSIQAAQQDPAG